MPQPHGQLWDRHSHGGLGDVLGRRRVLGHREGGLCPVLPGLWCLMSLELLQACVRGSPSAPLLRQKSGRALLKEQSSRKIFIDRKGIWSPPTLWQDNSQFPEDTEEFLKNWQRWDLIHPSELLGVLQMENVMDLSCHLISSIQAYVRNEVS